MMPAILKFRRKAMRTRHQDGWVEERGGRSRVWYGHYYVYVRNESGEEIRRHRGVSLGEKAKMRKWEAEAKLREIIGRAVKGVPQGNGLTLTWFIGERFLPLRNPSWRSSTRRTSLGIIEHHLLPALGDVPLTEIDKFKCQLLLNGLAERDYSFSIIDHCRTMLRAILEEALDQELIAKNPARKLANPETKEPLKPVLAKEQARQLLESLPLRDRLIAMIGAFCAMRPGEIFGLQWSSLSDGHFLVQGTVWHGVLQPGKAKTRGSKAPVTIPDLLQPVIQAWREESGNRPAEALMFPSRNGTALWPENWLRLNLRPFVRKLGITTPVNFQVLRRSFATHAQGHGTPKDVQSHLRHTDIGTTMNTYTQTVPESVRKLVNAVAEEIMRAPVVARVQ